VLQISPRTVNKHLEQVFQKLGVENRASAAAIDRPGASPTGLSSTPEAANDTAHGNVRFARQGALETIVVTLL